MSRIVLLADMSTDGVPDSIEVVRPAPAAGSGLMARLRRRAPEPDRAWVRQGVEDATGPVVVVAEPSEVPRLRSDVPDAHVVLDIASAVALLGVLSSTADVRDLGLADGDAEAVYRVLPDPPGDVPRLLADDPATASDGAAGGMRVAERAAGDSPFLELRSDRVLVRGDVDSGTFGVRASPVPVPGSPQTDGGVRLLLGPANYAGQGWAWARAAETHLEGVTARNVQITPRAVSGFAANRSVTGTEWRDPSLRLRLALDELLPATHVVIEAMRGLVGARDPRATAHGWDAELAADDVLAIHRSGRPVALLFHGSEVRRTDLHPTITAASPFTRPEYAEATQRLTTTTTTVHRLLGELRDAVPGLPVLVSTPDLLDHVPEARWLPVVVPRAAFAPGPPVLESGRPRVLHAPTNPFLKGSDVADEVLTRLDAEGVIHYRRVSGVPSVLMGDLIREVDVVVDQIVLGNPGVLAAEAMAAGRAVVAHLPRSVRDRFPVEPPAIEADRDTLEEVVRGIAADPAAARTAAEAGPAFARELHDGRRSAEVLGALLGAATAP